MLKLLAWLLIACSEIHALANDSTSNDTQEYKLPDKCCGEKPQEPRRKRSSEQESAANNQSLTDLADKYSKEFIMCIENSKVLTIESDDYVKLNDTHIYVSAYNKTYNVTDYAVLEDLSVGVCYPGNTTEESTIPKFDLTLATITEIGIGISLFCILIHMVTFLVVRSMQNLPGFCLFSLCVSLAIAYSCMLASNILDLDSSCADLMMLRFYFFLASFFWMNVLSYDVWRSLRLATAKLRLMTHMWLRFAMYSLYAWGTSLTVVAVAMIIDSQADASSNYKLTVNPDACWFQEKRAQLLYFGAPLFTLMFLNLAFFVWSFIMIHSATMKNAENLADLWSRFCIFGRLFIVMGLTWIIGMIAAVAQNIVVWYLFVIFNSSQGILIFFSFTISDKVKRALKSKMKRGKICSTPTNVSIHSHQATTTI